MSVVHRDFSSSYFFFVVDKPLIRAASKLALECFSTTSIQKSHFVSAFGASVIYLNPKKRSPHSFDLATRWTV